LWPTWHAPKATLERVPRALRVRAPPRVPPVVVRAQRVPPRRTVLAIKAALFDCFDHDLIARCFAHGGTWFKCN
jgi:hypothetical protein